MSERFRSLFETSLSSKMLVRLNIIDNNIGHAIFVKVYENNFSISAEVKNNIPIISCREDFNFSITDISHEIWHLYIKAELGIHSYQFEGALKEHLIKFEGGRKNFIDKWEQLISGLEHFYFLPIMLKENHKDCYLFLENTLDGLGDINCNYEEGLAKLIIDSFNRDSALQVIHILILNNQSERANEFLDSFSRNNNTAYTLGLEAYNLIQNFTHINQEPDILKQLISLLWKYPDPINFILSNNVGIFS